MDDTLKGIIGDYRNSIRENNIQTPNMGEYGLISQITFSLYIEIDKIDNINKVVLLGQKDSWLWQSTI